MNPVSEPLQALVDQDIQPREHLRKRVSDTLDITVGVETSEEALVEGLQEKRVLFTTSRLSVTRQVLAAASTLDLVAKVGTGLDSIDLDAARHEGVGVIYTPGLNALSVAEHTLALLLAVNRNVVSGRDTLQAGGWRDEMPTASPVTQTTVGVVGFGNVGRRFAGLLRGFNTEVLAYDPYVHDIDADVTGTTLVDFQTLLEQSDALVITAELTAETRGMIDADALAQLSSDATIINTARGPIIDTDALVNTLERDEVAGVGLDVFKTEPLPKDSPFHEFENVVVTPHIAAVSERARCLIIDTITKCTLDYLSGDPVSERFVAIDPTGGDQTEYTHSR